jgi:hypothetical protein
VEGAVSSFDAGMPALARLRAAWTGDAADERAGEHRLLVRPRP